MSRKDAAGRSGRPVGTPQKLTRALQERLCAELRLSVAPNHAAEIVGITARTFYYWLEKGDQGIPPYVALGRAVRRAIAEAVCTLTARALAGGPGAAQALGILERRFPREFGRRIVMSKTREEAQRRFENDQRDAEPARLKPEAQRKFDEAIAIATAALKQQAASIDADGTLSAPRPKNTSGRRGRPVGRGQTLKSTVRAGILAALRIAVPAKYAAEREGIDECTFHSWLEKGQQGTGRYADFALAVRSATAEAVRNLTIRALAGGPGATEALSLLERRFPQDYAQRFAIDQPSDPDKNQLEYSLRLAAAIRSSPEATHLMHEALGIEAASS
jgi:hypothetical protein